MRNLRRMDIFFIQSACRLAIEQDMTNLPLCGEGGNIVGYKPQDGDRVIIIEDVITAGTAIRETMPVLKGCADVNVTDMFISVNRCEVGQNPGKTAVMEVGEEFGIKVHALVTVQDIREYLADKEEYAHLLPLMDAYMKQYCVF